MLIAGAAAAVNCAADRAGNEDGGGSLKGVRGALAGGAECTAVKGAEAWAEACGCNWAAAVGTNVGLAEATLASATGSAMN